MAVQSNPGDETAPEDDAPDEGAPDAPAFLSWPDTTPVEWSLPPGEPPPPDPPGPVRRTAVVLAILLPFVVSVLGLVWAIRQGPNPQVTRALDDGGASIERLEDGAYALWSRNLDGGAVRWNACEPIHWVFNPNGAPLGAVDQLQIAIERVEAATGLSFAYDGESDELPTRNRAPWQPDRYDRERWAPVLISWRTPATTDAPLTDADRAVAIPVAVGDQDERAFVTAQVIFNRELAGTPGFDDRRRSIGITMLHELLHVVGLQHVDDAGEIMFPFPVFGDADFGPGDLAGMREVGSAQACLETPTPANITVEYG